MKEREVRFKLRLLHFDITILILKTTIHIKMTSASNRHNQYGKVNVISYMQISNQGIALDLT